MGEASTGAWAHPTNFLVADLVAKYTLVSNLTKTWDLAASGSSQPFQVIGEEVAVAEVCRVPFSSLFFFLIPRSLPFMLLPPINPSESHPRLLPGR